MHTYLESKDVDAFVIDPKNLQREGEGSPAEALPADQSRPPSVPEPPHRASMTPAGRGPDWEEQTASGAPRRHDRERRDYQAPEGAACLDVDKVARRLGIAPDALRRAVRRWGRLQCWVLARLVGDAGTDSCPPWISITALAAEYAGGQPGRQEVESIRRVCMRLAQLGLVETSQLWIQREEKAPALTSLRRQTKTWRRHLCIQLSPDAGRRIAGLCS